MRKKLSKLTTILGVPLFREMLLRHHVAAGIEHCPVLNLLDCVTVVDIGANKGQFALVARHFFPAARIISFEPLARPAAIFRALFAGDHAVKLFDVAVGPESGETTIHVSAREDSSSLLPITAMQNSIFPGTAEAATAQISVGPLHKFIGDADISAPALLKLDVQGFEIGALKGCEKLLHTFEFVYVECSFIELYEGQALANEVIDWLHRREFRISGVYNMSYDADGRAIQADFLFRRKP